MTVDYERWSRKQLRREMKRRSLRIFTFDTKRSMRDALLADDAHCGRPIFWTK